MIADYPALHQIPQLRILWKEAFGDSDVFLDAFFEYGFSPRRCRCMTEAGEVVSALHWFEASYDGQRFAYLYAVATAAACRGRGLFSALLADTKKVLTAEGFDGILLLPERESLRKMYEKFGFSCCTTVDTFVLSAGEEPVIMEEVGAETFARLRRQMLPEGGVLQEDTWLPFLASQYRFWRGEGWLAAGQVYDGKLICQEFLGDRNAMGGLVRALEVPAGTFRVPGKTMPFVYLLPLQAHCKRPDYFALVLD